MAVELDEYPIHQLPMSMAHLMHSDRNAYDRNYFSCWHPDGELNVITGIGFYPNLGTKDAFLTVQFAGKQHTVVFSDVLDAPDMMLEVGGYRVHVETPLQHLRVSCDGGLTGISAELEFHGTHPVIDESAHTLRGARRRILDACRFAQVGVWQGWIALDGTRWEVDSSWFGTRDRSWGIRPSGEAEPPGRSAAEADPNFGFWWNYYPLDFGDCCIVLIAQEDASGFRTLNDALRFTRVTGEVDQLGWPAYRVRYQPGTRIPIGARVEMVEPSGAPLLLEISSGGSVALNCGCGYGSDPDWTHGSWQGRKVCRRVDVDMSDPNALARVPFGVNDHLGRATLVSDDGQRREGRGLFEHGCIGVHRPSGFHDWASVAPES